MLFFASFTSGLAALIAGFVVLISGVGLYAVLIWPLTFWDLANLGLEKYGNWAGTIALSVFAGGALAGYWVFSGGPLGSKRTVSVGRVAVRSQR